jgi:hypothetical protein
VSAAGLSSASLRRPTAARSAVASRAGVARGSYRQGGDRITSGAELLRRQAPVARESRARPGCCTISPRGARDTGLSGRDVLLSPESLKVTTQRCRVFNDGAKRLGNPRRASTRTLCGCVHTLARGRAALTRQIAAALRRAVPMRPCIAALIACWPCISALIACWPLHFCADLYCLAAMMRGCVDA